jgi:hypothetical protein
MPLEGADARDAELFEEVGLRLPAAGAGEVEGPLEAQRPTSA